jgi:hypothetical protein
MLDSSGGLPRLLVREAAGSLSSSCPTSLRFYVVFGWVSFWKIGSCEGIAMLD